ncbi:MAG: thioredoxin family protein [Planctomycetota bacterium]
MTKRKVEVFSAGCALCAETVKLVEGLACPSCDVAVLDIHDEEAAQRARDLGVRAVPAVAVDGVLLDCCRGGVEEQVLRDAGVGSPVS